MSGEQLFVFLLWDLNIYFRDTARVVIFLMEKKRQLVQFVCIFSSNLKHAQCRNRVLEETSNFINLVTLLLYNLAVTM